ncbi:ATP-binding protein [Methylomonas sp. MED-D]|uniref:histidine kinase n=1 Tax=Methylomonas koyamae TaxID=702114 RepID=A0A177NR04_9GAMM|nr:MULTISPECIES: ATP-binding protein [Methylomonas]NJA07389.1 HAMP domain-containing histidine kinase [Methylococcaceae bacterium WWC4]MDT4329495.1 ATP-binding protein [Methylomonas sp. MV1]OAI19753.1 histidine kinase [Methylomonas koyamae]OHX36638.1 histidine kinase [Methylomonas sp. LWB]WGS87325.1 ATP-binding protein [Methylomonas sp. UP202]
MLSHILPKAEISIRENLRWLYILRNLMLFAVTVAVFIAVNGLGISLPQNQLWLAIFAISILNLYTWLRLRTAEEVTEYEIFSQICMDVLALAYLLYLTGGASNPIIWVFLLPLIITAIMLPQAYAWNMVIITSCVYTVLIAYNVPLPAIEPHLNHQAMQEMTPEMSLQMHLMNDRRYFNLHVFGMWFGFVFSAGLVAFFVVELSKTLKERERNLADARESALRDERVVSLGTLAASAAHDMGTPLGTIAILTHEMLEETPEHRNPDLYQKLMIVQQQIDRCKQALSVMSASAGEMRAESGKVMLVSEYIDEVLNQWRAHKPATKLKLFVSTTVDMDARIIAERTVTHSVINILNNAAEASPADAGIEFHVEWDDRSLSLKIRDFGPGLPRELLQFAGRKPVKSNKQGMGVGLFLTYTTIKRLGGTIVFDNPEAGGACVEISLPLLTKESTDDRSYG